MKSKQQLLILIGGPPWVGKTTCAEALFTLLHNSAWLDGDDVWQVNPFSVEDPRLRNSDKNMSFVLNTYLESSFDYTIFSSVVLTDKPITDGIIKSIKYEDYIIIFFMLICAQQELEARCAKRDNDMSPDPQFMCAAKSQDAVKIDTTHMTPREVAQKMLQIIDDPSGDGLVEVSHGKWREWKHM